MEKLANNALVKMRAGLQATDCRQGIEMEHQQLPFDS